MKHELDELDIIDVNFRVLTTLYDDHDCTAGPDDGCRGCQQYIEQTQDMIDAIKKTDALTSRKLQLMKHIQSVINKYFIYHDMEF